MRLIFRWGNRGLRMHRWGKCEKRERGVAALKPGSRSLQGPGVSQKRRESQGLHRDATKARWSALEARGLARYVFAWFFALLVQAACMFLLFVQAFLFKEAKMNAFLLSFLVSFGSDMAIVEPIEVLGIVMLPCLFNCGVVRNLRSMLRTLGYV